MPKISTGHQQSNNEEPMEKKRQFMSVRMPESVMAELRAVADKEMRTLAAQVLIYVMRGLQEDAKKV